MSEVSDFKFITDFIGNIIIPALGFLFLFYQIRQINKSIKSNTHQNIYVQVQEFYKTLFQHPELRKYFYDNLEIGLEHKDYERCMILAEMIVDQFGHIVIEKDNFKEKEYETWKPYIESIFQNSPIVRHFFNRNKSWYSDDLQKIFKEATASIIEENKSTNAPEKKPNETS